MAGRKPFHAITAKQMKNKSSQRFSRQTADARRQSLIAAAIRCLSRGSIGNFTIDHIAAEAGVSRGLINHHFEGIRDLLAAVYDSMTTTMRSAGDASLAVDGSAEKQLVAIIDLMLAPPIFSKSNLRTWLALWGEVAVNPRLKAAHRKSYHGYRQALARVIDEVARQRKLVIDGGAFATIWIALIDGLWLEWCLDSRVISREAARDAVYRVIEASIGKLQR